MGGGPMFQETHQSHTAPWSVNPPPMRRSVPTFRPLWKELPWHLEHPALFAFLAGSLFTAALWLLTSI